MDIHLPFSVPGNHKSSAARRGAKAPGHSPPLTLEPLEELTVPSAMPGALPAISALLPSGPAITAPIAPGIAPAGQELRTPSGIAELVSGRHSLQAPLPTGSKVLRTLANDLHQRTAPLPALASSALRGTVQQIANSIPVVARAVESSVGQQLRSTSSGTAPLVEILLSNIARDPAALPNNLTAIAGSAIANPAQQLNRVVMSVAADLNNVTSSLQALSGVHSGTTATTTGDATAQPTKVPVDVATSVSTVLVSLNALIGVLPDLISLIVSQARQYLRPVLLDITNSLGAISGSLETISGQLAGAVDSVPRGGPIVSAPDDRSARPPSSTIDGAEPEASDLLSTIGNLLGALAGSLSSIVAGGSAATPASAAGAIKIIDTFFSGVT